MYMLGRRAVDRGVVGSMLGKAQELSPSEAATDSHQG